MRAILTWLALATAVSIPIAVAANSPLLAWRDPIYIAAALFGVVGLSLMLVQPLLAGGYMPGLPARRGRRVHRWVGASLVLAVILHVAGLWLTSPPDVVDALLFRSPTPFSAWGVIAMWALFAAGVLALLRFHLQVPPRVWRIGHTALVLVAVAGTIAHALLIEGTMGIVSKIVLCVMTVAALGKTVLDLRAWTLLKRRRV